MSIRSADPKFARWTAAIVGLLCCIGIALAAHADMTTPSRIVTLHIVDKFGQAFDRTESLETYLFVSQFFQIFIFVMALRPVLWWKSFVRELFASSALPNPSFAKRGDPVIIYNGVCAMMVLMSVLMFIFTISRVTTIELYRYDLPSFWREWFAISLS